MTTVMTHEPSTDKPDRQGVAARLLVPGFWGAVSIVAMWLAVMFDGIFGGDMVFGNNAGGGPTIIPSAVPLGLFAVIGTASVSGSPLRRALGRSARAVIRLYDEQVYAWERLFRVGLPEPEQAREAADLRRWERELSQR